MLMRNAASSFAQLPAAEQLWAWCLQRSQDQLLDMLAVLAAATVDAVQRKAGGLRSELTHASDLADALSLDMRHWFVPGAENYFGQVNRAAILTAIDEAKGSHAPALEKLKKAELAVRAQDLVANTNWLPEPMRGHQGRLTAFSLPAPRRRSRFFSLAVAGRPGATTC
jgi:ParB family transcriptional regulator, chromosome partitioning protein